MNPARIALVPACIAALGLAGCAKPESETGRGTFVSATHETVTAIYRQEGGTGNRASVRLVLPDKTEVKLYRAVSGSGTRYTNETAEWWEHQGAATYSVAGTNVFRGTVVAAQ